MAGAASVVDEGWFEEAEVDGWLEGAEVDGWLAEAVLEGVDEAEVDGWLVEAELDDWFVDELALVSDFLDASRAACVFGPITPSIGPGSKPLSFSDC